MEDNSKVPFPQRISKGELLTRGASEGEMAGYFCLCSDREKAIYEPLGDGSDVQNLRNII